jgi:hypothetical protein
MTAHIMLAPHTVWCELVESSARRHRTGDTTGPYGLLVMQLGSAHCRPTGATVSEMLPDPPEG